MECPPPPTAEEAELQRLKDENAALQAKLDKSEERTARDELKVLKAKLAEYEEAMRERTNDVGSERARECILTIFKEYGVAVTG